MIGIVGGTGFETLISKGERKNIKTPSGEIGYVEGMINNVEIIFIPRHGFKHENPPHKVPYKEIISAFYSLGIERVVGISAVGSLREDLPPGSIVIPTQLIDYTKRRETFYDYKAVHVDVTRPYCREMIRIIRKKALEIGIDIKVGFKYIATEGPRFETPSEINMFRMFGADIVGMTNVPEAFLAREAGIHYMLLTIVTNYAAGMQDMVDMDEVYVVTKSAEENLYKLIRESIDELDLAKLDDDCIRYRDYFTNLEEGE